MIGINSGVALTFSDAEAAQETLAGISQAREVLGAVIYDADGEPFALYSRAGAGAFQAPVLAAVGHRFEGQRLHVFEEIRFRKARVGKGVFYLARVRAGTDFFELCWYAFYPELRSRSRWV